MVYAVCAHNITLTLNPNPEIINTKRPCVYFAFARVLLPGIGTERVSPLAFHQRPACRVTPVLVSPGRRRIA